MKKKIGITSTIPIEIIYAADMIPVDLNNIFITHEDPGRFLMTARKDGFPETCCSWISGIYGIVKESGIETVVGVVGGDCSETIALMEVLSMKGIEVLSFAYPHSKLKHLIKEELLRFAQSLDVNIRYAEEEKIKLDSIRQRIHHLDDLLWRENKAYGEEVHLFQLASSDFDGDPKKFKERINNKITEIEKRKPIDTDIRLGYVGVPPIISDLYSFIEKDNVRIVYNEVQRQFSLPVLGKLEQSYCSYTYPYGIYSRLKDIKTEIEKRNIDGIIHYIQSFCFRGIEDIVLREKLNVPILTIQGDFPGSVNATTGVRIEAFLDILFTRKKEL